MEERSLKVSDFLLAFVCIVVVVFGGVNLKANSLKVHEFEAQGIELNIQGVLPHTKQ